MVACKGTKLKGTSTLDRNYRQLWRAKSKQTAVTATTMTTTKPKNGTMNFKENRKGVKGGLKELKREN